MSRILVFDSGVGGLSVAREIRKAVPQAHLTYLADDVGFPYGDWDGDALNRHVVDLLALHIDRNRPEAVVIACNTASTLVLPALRERFDIPFVGTVPAIKPAAERTKTGLISVLATPGTMERDYTRNLIDSFAAHCSVRLVGCSSLATMAEAVMRGEPVSDAVIEAEVRPAFVEIDGRRTDHIVLACTHYPFLLERLHRLPPWPVEWIDPAPAIARRVMAVLDGADRVDAGVPAGAAHLVSEKRWPGPLHNILGDIGLDPVNP